MAATETTIQEPVLSVTPSAAEQIRSMQSGQPENAGKPLRVYVEGGGCSGLQYGMVFDEKRDGDWAGECLGVPVVVDAASVEYLQGTVIDFSEALTGGGFKISNPKARSSCGCGKSFEA
jgi:iron-sulfur cluster assembly accessory protein